MQGNNFQENPSGRLLSIKLYPTYEQFFIGLTFYVIFSFFGKDVTFDLHMSTLPAKNIKVHFLPSSTYYTKPNKCS